MSYKLVSDNGETPNRNVFWLGVTGVCFLFFLIFAGKLFQNVDADELVCIQSPLSGKLTWHTSAGVKWQGYGGVTTYEKLEIYPFNIPVRFNDGGHGTVMGSINYQMPLDVTHLNELQTMYGSQDAIQKNLIETVTNKCVYMTGPLMSSKESYAEKRTSLIHYIEDQIENGVYKTTQKEIKVKDAMTGQDKTTTVVEIVLGQDGMPLRQEEAVLKNYGIRTSNFAVSSLPYDDNVEKQIQQQQVITMQVQTAIASAKEAEQQAITVAKQGEANAAKAKWEQEVIKAKMVTEAEQKLEVAKLEKLAAEQNKQKSILEGQGEGEKRRAIMVADGALDKKLAAWVEVNKAYASEFSKQKWVPEVQMGGSGERKNSAQDMIDLLTLNSAKSLSLDMGVKK